MAPGPRVVVVTDSTASLPAGAAGRRGVEVVPLEVGLGDARFREGVDLRTADLLAALTEGVRVTTSQPPPHAFAEAYARAAARGAREIVSVHLSGELSGTVEAARAAAGDAPVPVHVVDSRTVAMGLGFAALAAADLAAAPADADPGTGGAPGGVGEPGRPGPADVPDGARVAERARAVAASTSSLFVVDSLDHLRRGGRIGATAAAVGGVLGVRPLLTVRDGRVEVAGTVRTRRAARERLVEAVLAHGGARPGARVAVHHLGSPDAAEALAEAVRARLRASGASGASGASEAPGAGRHERPGDPAEDAPGVPAPEVVVADVSAVVGAHAGPGLLGVVVAPPPDDAG